MSGSKTHDQTLAWHSLTVRARIFLALVITSGLAILLHSAWHWSSPEPAELVCYLLVALLASRMKVNLPGLAGTMSASFLVVLAAVAQLTFPEVLLIGCITTLAQSLPSSRHSVLHGTFNVCATVAAIAATESAYHWPVVHRQIAGQALALVLASCTYFIANTLPAAIVISLAERSSLRRTWTKSYFWAFPYYIAGAGMAAVLSWLNGKFGWQVTLLMLPGLYMIYRSYGLYLGKFEAEKRHAEEMALLHLRTIEVLALAIEAKDQHTHDHLQRVRIYAVEIAKELKVKPAELEALQAAALLHDIGKLAVPEHIVSKPGKLTPEEFEKMKIHPVVGAELLDRVEFPYPVAPIVRAHHEKWDGSGYPYGLKGEEIPIGARILTAVDFFDALASDRQYRRALPVDEVVARLSAESGKHFDPQVVNVLLRRYKKLETLVQQDRAKTEQKLSTEVRVERGAAPASGFETSSQSKLPPVSEATFLDSVASAKQEVQTLFEISQEMGTSLSLDDTLSVFASKIRRVIPYDSIVIYVRNDGMLVPQHVSGESFRLLSALRIPMGEGVSGWVAENRKPMLNGNPSVEPGYLNQEAGRSTCLNSALSVPLEGLSGVAGVVTLYHAEKDGFSTDHLRILLAVSSKMALAIENALKFQQAESSATTDYLTGLPNARSMFLQLGREVARAKRAGTILTVMVCDLDGFKQVNDRFGHLEGNRVLELFAQRVRESCREYDYVARMGGDEFVVIVPNLSPEAESAKVSQLRDLARAAGREVCGEDLLSLSVGKAVYPDDAEDMDKLLAEADRRMYAEKEYRSGKKNRRSYPRLGCCVVVELQPVGSQTPVLGKVANISVRGCYVETGLLLAKSTRLTLTFATHEGRVSVEGTVVRSLPAAGVALVFNVVSVEDREKMKRLLAFVESTLTDTQTGKQYLKTLTRK
jgi:diguanylate cyclase (GGDEF)-like protein/putative nucleotidyltransferase with HDIG domain